MAYPFELPDLGYPFDALEPHVDARTMEIHHDKHHAGYTKKLNAALEEHSSLQGGEAEQLLRNIESIPGEIRTAVRNNGGGYVNHSLFWEIMKPGGSSEPAGAVSRAIEDAFGSFDRLQEQVTTAAKTQFGSGWGWLVVDGFGDLQVLSTANQDSPLMSGKTPILGVDVWEHAYYLNYQNRRADYLDAWWNVVNWDVVDRRYEEARG